MKLPLIDRSVESSAVQQVPLVEQQCDQVVSRQMMDRDRAEQLEPNVPV